MEKAWGRSSLRVRDESQLAERFKEGGRGEEEEDEGWGSRGFL